MKTFACPKYTRCSKEPCLDLIQLTQQPHSRNVANLWSAPSFVILKESQGNCKESLLEIPPTCEEPCLSLNPQSDETNRQRILLQDENHSGNDPRFVPGFPGPVSGRSWNCSGVCLYLWVQENFVLFRQSKMRDSFLLKSWDNVLVTLLSISTEP